MPNIQTMLGDLYPFTSHFLDVSVPAASEPAKMHYVDEGEGEPMVFLHGNPTWSFFYRRLLKAFAPSHRVVAPDHVGCGLSDKPQQYAYTLSTHIRNVTRLIDHLDLRDITLVVHDWGGAIGMGWAVENVNRIKRLVILNTAAFLGFTGPLRIRFCALPVIGEIVIQRLNGFARPALSMACHKRDRMTPRVRQGYLAPYRSVKDRIAHLRFVRDIPYNEKIPSYEVLKHIDGNLQRLRHLPMLICWGERDFCFNQKFLGEWERRFPRAEVHAFADAGHYVLEDAADEIIPILREFLNRRASV